MDTVDAYLRIPASYGEALGKLRWSPDGEAIEFADGGTFAFGGEIVSFLEGFSLQRTFPPFGQILHLLGLLRHKRPDRAGELDRLHQVFRAAGQVHRNAGAFCAVLCRDLPSAPEPPSSWQVWRRVVLRSFSTQPEFLSRREDGEEPLLPPRDFEIRISAVLKAYDDEELLHWFKHARGPIKEPARRIAEVLDAERPRSLQGILGQLAQHERLSGAIPYVAQLVSALALPPRRMGPPELPLGGYSDVTNRGQPEHILPSQFALDDLEFIRRFAEREMLYYRREEPHARTREGLVVVLDQGVRTWGAVRLVLAAALLAFGQFAERRRLPFRVAATSGGGAPLDPLQLSDETLAELVQSSDLTPNPALALERTLLDESSQNRDIVLLTHPFSLAEADLAAAARRLRPDHRLFAVSVDGHGAVQLSELRQGVPLPVSRFHVDLEPRPAEKPDPLRSRPAPGLWRPWTGDVEPVGFPFRFGVESDPKPTLLFAFDHAGHWLLTASSHGMLHVTRTDGSASEILPRGLREGKVLREVDAVLGVAGGFVVAGELEGTLVAFHYHLHRRRCTAHVIASGIHHLDRGERGCWYYFRELHSVVVLAFGAFHALDLDSGTVVLRPQDNSRAGRALEKAPRFPVTPPQLVVGTCPPPSPEYGWAGMDEKSGEVILSLPGQGQRRFTPLADGQPTLRGHQLLMAQHCQSTLVLALQAGNRNESVRLCLYRIPEGVPVGDYDHRGNQWAHTVSSDGRLLARQIGPLQVEIRSCCDAPQGRVTTPLGGFHSGATLHLGDCWLWLQVTPQITHAVRWDRGELVCLVIKRGFLATRGTPAEVRRIPPWAAYDSHRFQRAAWSNLIAVLDRFGQVFLFDRAGALLCGLFAFQDDLAVWMPDGTCCGSETLLGRRPTPEASKRIGQRLLEAWRNGEGTST